MPTTPKPETIEEALTLFPGVTASARYSSAAWQFRLESDELFLFLTTPRRRSWQTAFRDASIMYKKNLTDWELAQIKANALSRPSNRLRHADASHTF